MAAATQALGMVEVAVRRACTPGGAEIAGAAAGPGEALDALRLMRDMCRRLALWEPGLIEAARGAGASRADIAHPLSVSSRQAAERRYLRLCTGHVGITGEQRIQAIRDRRAADRAVSAWARGNAADLRRPTGEITSLTGLCEQARAAMAELGVALGEDDPVRLIGPLAKVCPYPEGRRDLAGRVDRVMRQVENLRSRRKPRTVSGRPRTAGPERPQPGRGGEAAGRPFVQQLAQVYP
ncbi:type III effector protein [Streptomyces sp. NBC_00057]|uniref:type III effector protein n=1 Tax=Streptomyces sp. NBC_00057 TaxID=2975634 RepID=UPI0032464C53